ncbi:hypothetical protein [Desulfobacter vibrioformis]|jgi:hypothetical protein|uniref:hypothetical protein n=1 Tax=Desulfobacter vibrioformis TaxID=34031 RepID=UPI000556DE72|nr:hypothetical protein [Desulfobacter vibrioformis]
MIEILIEKKLFIPLAQIASALIALFAVIVTQILLSNRSRKEIEAKFNLLKKEQEHSRKSELIKEILKKAEEIFLILQVSLEELYSTREKLDDLLSNKNKTEEDFHNFLKHAREVTKRSIQQRLKAELLVNIYIPNLKPVVEHWRNLENQTESCCAALEGKAMIMKNLEEVEAEPLWEVYCEHIGFYHETSQKLSECTQNILSK